VVSHIAQIKGFIQWILVGAWRSWLLRMVVFLYAGHFFSILIQKQNFTTPNNYALIYLKPFFVLDFSNNKPSCLITFCLVGKFLNLSVMSRRQLAGINGFGE
jgi:hypothetical protein